MSDVREEVREHYARAARSVAEDGCCGGTSDCGSPGSQLYGPGDRELVPDAALLASLGCGNPTAVAEMLALARRNAEGAGATNVEFLQGYIEEIPLPGAAVDVVISNCVINLSPDKARVFAEMARVLKPGGRIGISDIVAEDSFTPEQRAERGSYAGCIAGALSFREYEEGLRAAGFQDVSVTPTHSVADGMHSAIIRAIKRRQ